MIIDIDVFVDEGYIVFADDHWDGRKDVCCCGDEGAAPVMQENASALLIAQWPHGIGELFTIDEVVMGCRDEAEDIPMLTCELEWYRYTIQCNFTLA